MAKMKRGDIGGGSDVAPLPVRVYKNIGLERLFAFQQVSKYTGKQQVMLSWYWPSGHPMSNTDGEVITDDNGNQKMHYFNDGFIKLSFDQRSNMYPILRAMGFRGEGFMDEEGNYLADLDIDIEFGKNAKGEDFAGRELDELPIYNGGSKKDCEVEVTKFTINGVSVLGRRVNLDIDVKDGWNRIAQYMPADDPMPLKVNGQTTMVEVEKVAAPQAAPAQQAPADPVRAKQFRAMREMIGRAIGHEPSDAEVRAATLHTAGLEPAQLTAGQNGSIFVVYNIAKEVVTQGVDPHGALLPPNDAQLDGAFGEDDPFAEEAPF